MRPLTLTDFYEAEGSTLQPPDPDDEPMSSQAFIDTHSEPSPQTDEGPARSDALVIEKVSTHPERRQADEGPARSDALFIEEVSNSECDSDNESRLFQTDAESTTLDGEDSSSLKDDSSDCP